MYVDKYLYTLILKKQCVLANSFIYIFVKRDIDVMIIVNWKRNKNVCNKKRIDTVAYHVLKLKMRDHWLIKITSYPLIQIFSNK